MHRTQRIPSYLLSNSAYACLRAFVSYIYGEKKQELTIPLIHRGRVLRVRKSIYLRLPAKLARQPSHLCLPSLVESHSVEYSLFACKSTHLADILNLFYQGEMRKMRANQK